MTDAQSRFTYRLLDADGNTVEETELPTDGEAVHWAEGHRGADGVPTYRRIERRDGERWAYVSEAGVTDVDRGNEDL